MTHYQHGVHVRNSFSIRWKNMAKAYTHHQSSRRHFLQTLVLGSAGLGLTACGASAGKNVPSNKIDIRQFGAKGDGKYLNTNAIQSAIDLCHKNGGGKVSIPAGVFLTGGLVLKSHVSLHLSGGAILLGSTEHKDYVRQPQPEYRSLKDPGGWYALIYAEGATNIGISGKGTINGNGPKQVPRPDELNKDMDGRPRNILFISCNDIDVSDVKVYNSGLWGQHYLNCENVIIDNIRVYNHGNRNNDGIDIDGCRRFILVNSIFDCHDDAICLKSTGLASSEDIIISNCIASSFANGIKAGTESTGGFRNININNCIVKPSIEPELPPGNLYREGITGISLIIVDGGHMEGVSVSNITIEQTMCPLYVRLGGRNRKHRVDAPEPEVGSIKNVSISNITAYNCGNFTSSITGIPNHPIQNIQLNNINIVHQGGLTTGDYLSGFDDVKEDIKGYPQPTAWNNLPASGLFLRHVKDVVISNYKVNALETDNRPVIMADDVHSLKLHKISVGSNCNQEKVFDSRNVSSVDIESI